MDEFLKLEYEKCLELLKHYDERQLSLMKFTTGVSSSVITLVFGFHAVSPTANQYFWNFVAILTGIAGLGLLAVFVAMVQNRLYFVYPARQVNAIRRTMLSKISSEFSDNQMYVASNFPAFKLFSLHTLLSLLVAVQVGAFLGFCWFAITLNPTAVQASIIRSALFASVASIVLFTLAAIYLRARGQYHPDKGVHLVDDPKR